MKVVLCAMTLLFPVCAPTYAQTPITGTWRVDVVGGQPWELALKVDGKQLIGLVSSCSSAQGAFDIFDAKVAGNIVSFKCRSGDSQRTVSLTGTINGDEAVFYWKLEWNKRADSGGRERAISAPVLGTSAPPQFTARRGPEGRLAQLLNGTRGADYTGAVNLVEHDIRADSWLFIPEKVSRIHAVLVVVRFGLGRALEEQNNVRPDWEKLSEQTESALLFVQVGTIGPSFFHRPFAIGNLSAPEALVALLKRLAQDSGHREVADAPLVLWGHSAAGELATRFAQAYPERTIAIVTYHAFPDGDMKILSRIPALLMAGGKDTEDPQNLKAKSAFSRGRDMGASWTFGLDIDSPHGDEAPFPFLKRANALMMPWITAIIQQRVAPDGKNLRPVTNSAAWLGNHQTGEVAPIENFSGSKMDASWLPDEASARGWQALNAVRK